MHFCPTTKVDLTDHPEVSRLVREFGRSRAERASLSALQYPLGMLTSRDESRVIEQYLKRE